MNDSGKPAAAGGMGRATAAGMAAVLLWSCLALLTTLTAGIPPFELLALSFGIAFVLGTALLALGQRGAWLAAWRQPRGAWATGFLGQLLAPVVGAGEAAEVAAVADAVAGDEERHVGVLRLRRQRRHGQCQRGRSAKTRSPCIGKCH